MTMRDPGSGVGDLDHAHVDHVAEVGEVAAVGGEPSLPKQHRNQ